MDGLPPAYREVFCEEVSELCGDGRAKSQDDDGGQGRKALCGEYVQECSGTFAPPPLPTRVAPGSSPPPQGTQIPPDLPPAPKGWCQQDGCRQVAYEMRRICPPEHVTVDVVCAAAADSACGAYFQEWPGGYADMYTCAFPDQGYDESAGLCVDRNAYEGAVKEGGAAKSEAESIYCDLLCPGMPQCYGSLESPPPPLLSTPEDWAASL
jgi:hypothetical protein